MIPLAQPDIREEERKRVEAVLEQGLLADGPEVRAFEHAFRDVTETEHAVATSNGTTALHAALEGLGIGRGDTVLTTPFSFIATANAARLCGATVTFADIDSERLTLDPDALEERLESGTTVDAVIAVHLFGLPAELERLETLSEEYDFALIEDAAQAHGARYKGQPIGSFGDAACFSFYPTKNVTCGEGGMVTTNDDELADRIRRFIDHGQTDRYVHPTVGHNFRLSSVHAAIGCVQLDRLNEYTRTRRRNAAQLSGDLTDTPVHTPPDPNDRIHVYHQYTVRHPERDRIRKSLSSRDIESAIYYPTPIHRQPAYGEPPGSYPIAEQAAKEVLSIPVHPGLEPHDVDRIQRSVRSALEATA